MSKYFLPEPTEAARQILQGGHKLTPVALVPVSARRGMSDSSWGELLPFVSDPAVTDIFINGMRGAWVDRGQGAVKEERLSFTAAALQELIVRLIALGNRHIDEANPCVDVRLHGGVRVHAVLPPISGSEPLLSVRLPSLKSMTLANLQQRGMLQEASARWLRQQIIDRKNLLITGAGGSGKTTLLGALLGEVPESERIILIEDVAEINAPHPHVVSLEARQANSEGAGEVTLTQLVKNALRMRPDRLVLGECRGEEIRELLSALNTGHDGGAGTLHANSLFDVPARLEALGALAGMSSQAVARQAFSALDLIVHLERSDGVRRVSAVGALEIADGRLVINEVLPVTLEAVSDV